GVVDDEQVARTQEPGQVAEVCVDDGEVVAIRHHEANPVPGQSTGLGRLARLELRREFEFERLGSNPQGGIGHPEPPPARSVTRSACTAPARYRPLGSSPSINHTSPGPLPSGGARSEPTSPATA